MSYFFILNNIHFAIETFAALVFLIGAGLSYDALALKKDFAAVSRLVGFVILTVWHIIIAANLTDELNVYLAGLPIVIGFLLIFTALYSESQFKQGSVMFSVVLVALLSFYVSFALATTVIAFGVAYLAYRQYRKEYKVIVAPFYKAFIFIAISYLLSLFAVSDNSSLFTGLSLVSQAIGLALLFWWTWQYLQLRIREEISLLFFSGALVVSTVVTLAFSSILVGYVNNSTKNSLQTDVRFFEYSVEMLKGEFLAKTRLFVANDALRAALVRGDELALYQVASDFAVNEGLGFLTIANRNGDVVARANATIQRGENLSSDLGFKTALSGKTFAAYGPSGIMGLAVLVSAPIYDRNKIIGVASAGVPFDNALVDNIKRITGLEMSVFQNDTRVATTVLNPDGRTRTIGIKEADPEVVSKVLNQGQQVTKNVEILSQSYYVSYLPIKGGDGKNVGMISAMKAEKDIVGLLNTTNRLTLVTVVIIMLLMLLPIHFLTERLAGEI